jgi:hypothetical protein
MSPQEEIAKQQISVFLKETSEIFYWIKNYSVLVEQLLPENKAPIHAANELKSVIFHLYNSINLPDHVHANIDEAKAHLCRAFYDLHSMVVSIYIKQITEKVSQFKQTTIAQICPEYSQTIRPSMRSIQTNLREIRSNRNTDMALLQSGIKLFEEHAKALASYGDIIEESTPHFLKYEKEEKNRRRKDKKWDVIKILITAIVTATLTYFVTIAITKKKMEIENSKPPTEQVTPKNNG